MITGNTLIEWGFKPGPWFKAAIETANAMISGGSSDEEIRLRLTKLQPPNLIELRTNNIPFEVFLEAHTEEELENLEGVITHMDNLMRVPTIKHGAVMPDACSAGSQPGTIPVGGIVACENAIHPSFHSADICCSVAISVLNRNVDVGRILDTAQAISHFGPGGRQDNGASNHTELQELLKGFEANPFLSGLETRAMHHFMTQGDGNHFFFVGDLNGHTVIVTHHGSRGLGADLYKRGKAVAIRETRKLARVPEHQAWIPAFSEQGAHYWSALQTIRSWTKLNHFSIHDAVARALGVRVADRWWNEHNFVFLKSDGLFYHAKGATPNYLGFASDSDSMTLVPLNMGAGVLLVDTVASKPPIGSLEFCPHGAGRNLSRSDHMRRLTAEYGDSRGLSPRAIEAIIERETQGIDARFWTGRVDLSELPSAYKPAAKIIAEIESRGLAAIKAHIKPLGSIMAGNDDRDWRSIKARKQEAAAE